MYVYAALFYRSRPTNSRTYLPKPAFTHLSFSAAFALFTFAEYVRYFAIYPFGAVVHLFMNEFLDHKDSGTAILSHFYLLTGCAGSVWLEGYAHCSDFVSRLLMMTCFAGPLSFYNSQASSRSELVMLLYVFVSK